MPIGNQVFASRGPNTHQTTLGICIVDDGSASSEKIISAGKALQEEAKTDGKYLIVESPSSFLLTDVFDEKPAFEKNLAIGIEELSEGRRKYNQLSLDEVLGGCIDLFILS